MHTDDITSLQGKTFEDLVAYASFLVKPKAAFVWGVTPKTAGNIVAYARQAEGTVNVEEHMEDREQLDGKGGIVTVPVRVREKWFTRKFIGDSVLQRLFIAKKDVPAMELSREDAAMFKGTTHVVEDPKTLLLRDFLGEGVPETEQVLYENEEIDLIALDLTNMPAVPYEFLDQIKPVFAGALVIRGAEKYQQLPWQLLHQFGGSCILVLSSADGGTCLLIREELVV